MLQHNKKQLAFYPILSILESKLNFFFTILSTLDRDFFAFCTATFGTIMLCIYCFVVLVAIAVFIIRLFKLCLISMILVINLISMILVINLKGRPRQIILVNNLFSDPSKLRGHRTRSTYDQVLKISLSQQCMVL